MHKHQEQKFNGKYRIHPCKSRTQVKDIPNFYLDFKVLGDSKIEEISQLLACVRRTPGFGAHFQDKKVCLYTGGYGICTRARFVNSSVSCSKNKRQTAKRACCVFEECILRRTLATGRRRVVV